MAKALLLAEKPSQAQDLAKGLGEAFSKRDGYLEGFNYLITWCFGHLVELEDAEAYGEQYAKWNLDALPIFPEEFKYSVKPGARKQFRSIKELLKGTDITQVVICTDPGREGELIARLVLRLAGNKKPVKRFWVSKALTPGTVREGFAQLKDARDYDRLFLSAQLRQQADWLIGINATRAFTVVLNDLYSVGRVQTPTLKIIVEREHEIEAFRPVDYWIVRAQFRHKNGTYDGLLMPAFAKGKAGEAEPETDGEDEEAVSSQESQFRVSRREAAVAAAGRVRGQGGQVKSAEEKEGQEPPPFLFSLTDLQKEANRAHGFSAKETLDLAQSLYEKHKALSYPRTESRHLNGEMAPEAGRIMQALKNAGTVKFDISKVSISERNKRVFDSSKLTDHHALIPTEQVPAALSQGEAKLYEMVVRRFVAAFCPPRKYKAMTVVTAVGPDEFLSNGMAVIDDGWRAVYGGGIKESILPPLRQGESVQNIKAEEERKKTAPPSRYTDASILGVMTNAQRFVSDPRLKEILKQTKGLGTPATRAAILESLIAREYVTKKGKQFIPTEKGKFLIEKLKGERIADPAYTALWEQELENLADGRSCDRSGVEAKASEFMEGIKEYTSEIVAVAKRLADTDGIKSGGGSGAGGANGNRNSLGKCPECQGEVYEGEKGFFCANGRGKGEGSCRFALWKNCLSRLGKRAVTAGQAATLLAGETIELKGLKSRKSGKPFSAAGKLAKHEKYGWHVELIVGDPGAPGLDKG